MDATSLVTEQHRSLSKLFADYFSSGEADEKRMLFLRIADELATHMALEERLFYPASYSAETSAMLDRASTDHRHARHLLETLLDGRVAGPAFDARLGLLQVEVERHMREEEEQLLPRVRAEYSAEELDQLGVEMANLRDEEDQVEPREQLERLDEASPP